MRNLKLVAIGAVMALTGCISNDAVKVSSFGYDKEDSTRFIQAALDSGAKTVIFDRQSGPWIAKPLLGRSNQEIVFEEGVELLAKRGEFHGKRDMLLTFMFCTNVVLRGEGAKGGTLRMWKTDYQDASKYEPAEWRYTLALYSVENARVENMSFVASGGDGICVAAKRLKDGKCVPSRNVTIKNCICDDNHRQAITVGCANNLLVEDCVFKNTKGTMPQSGVDFEPDRSDEELVNCVMRRCRFENNAGSGIEFYSQQLNGSTKPISILMDECVTISNRQETAIQYGGPRETDFVKGEFRFRNCQFGASSGKKKADFILRDSKQSGKIVFENCVGYDEKKAHRTHPMMDSILRQTGGRIPSRVKLPKADEVKIVDAQPGEMVELEPISYPGGGKFLFFAEAGQRVRFVARQLTSIKGRKPSKTPVKIISLVDGHQGVTEKAEQPGFEWGEIAFTAKWRGFYRLIADSATVRFQIKSANVPIALDTVSGKSKIVGVDHKPFSLYLSHLGKEPAIIAMAGDWYYKFRAELFDPSGASAWKEELVEDTVVTKVAGGKAGLWRLEFAKAKKPHYDWVHVDAFDCKSLFFLSKDKTWEVRQ